MKNFFVLDTNVLIHDPQALFSFGEDHVIIPITVIDEIDNFKKGLDEKGRNARQIGRYLDNLREKGSLKDGVPTKNGGIIQVVMSKSVENDVHEILFNDINDNLIIGTALHIKKQNPDSQVTMVSKDANVRIKADAVGLIATNFEEHNISFEELYSGISYKKLPEKDRNFLKKNKFLKIDTEYKYCNQFLIITWEDNNEETVLKYSKEKDVFYPLKYYIDNKEVFGIKALNLEQQCALDLLLDPEVRMVSLIGIAGTGKTLLAMAAGLQQVIEDDMYSRLIISRPIFPLGKDLGFLPGNKADKFNPWMQPIYDNMEILISGHEEEFGSKNQKVSQKKKSTLDEFLDYGFIVLEPLTYIRGRSLPNQFMIVDEAQNLTPHEMKTVITRAGEQTKIILTGDPYQIDIPYLDSQSNGLSTCVEKLKDEEIVGHVTLKKGERSKLADLAAKHF